MADGELSLIDQNISSLLEITLSPKVRSLNLHCNRIGKIEGLTAAWHIRQLDLSSNNICRMEGLGSLTSLRSLNLSCNFISKVEGLHALVNLVKLDLSYNQIGDLTGLLHLHGTEYKLKHLYLHSNQVNSMSQVLQCLLGLQSLTSVTFSMDGIGNPVCAVPGYRDMVVQSLPQLSSLDGTDRSGNPTCCVEESVMDILGLEELAEFLQSDSSDEKPPVDVTPPSRCIDEALTCFQGWAPAPAGEGSPSCPQMSAPGIRNRVSRLPLESPSSSPSVSTPTPARKPRRDTDRTSDSECDGRTENHPKGAPRRSRVPAGRRGSAVARKRSLVELRGQRSGSTSETPVSESKSATLPGKKVPPRSSSQQPLETGTSHEAGQRVAGRRRVKPGAWVEEEETFRVVVEERDQERERRWKAEQAVRKLTEQLQSLERRASEEKDIQSMALLTSDRLKEVVLKERSARVALQQQVEVLQRDLAHARSQEVQQQGVLRSLQDATARDEALRAQQRADEMRRTQEMENKVSALKRELEILRALARQRKDKLQGLQELLASREQEHRKELEARLVPGGPEFQEAVSSTVALVQRGHDQQLADMREKLVAAERRYGNLEDEFRVALTIEANRFAEVKASQDLQAAELVECRVSLSKSQKKEHQTGLLVQELTAMVKEQKARIAELMKSKQEVVSELRSRVRSLEVTVEEDKRLAVQAELLKQDKAKLQSQLTAQESVIDGLRAERKLWGQELAHQGASLAQDRGRLEARIEVLTTELQTLKKQGESDASALKIKAKIVDDQTETIRKLKEGLQQRDEQIRNLRDEALQAERRFQAQLEEVTAPVHELRTRVEQLSARKEEVKRLLEDREAELEEVKREHSAISRKWQEKVELLTRLESQVRRMKENFDSKGKVLVEEKERAQQAQRATVEKLRHMDDAFRRQMEVVQVSHQAEVQQLASDKQKEVELAKQRVLEVEEEMRQLLEETESRKRTMDEKMRLLTSVLKDF